MYVSVNFKLTSGFC